MALQQLPVIESTVNVVHTGDVADFTGFTTTLDGSDGAPLSDQSVFTFDLNVFAPSLIDAFPQVDVFYAISGEKAEADIEVDSELITITFFEDVTPTSYRVKVIG